MRLDQICESSHRKSLALDRQVGSSGSAWKPPGGKFVPRKNTSIGFEYKASLCTAPGNRREYQRWIPSECRPRSAQCNVDPRRSNGGQTSSTSRVLGNT